jgi:1-acyl-sn-glycerol-3-phosphate acyltransferase
MQSIFVTLNRYLEKRKWLFFLLFLGFLVAAAVIAGRVRLEENLNAIIPDDQRITQISAVFSGAELTDQIVFILSDTSKAEGDPDRLIRQAALLAGRLEEDSSLVREIRFKAGGDMMMGLYDLVYNHLPLFLDDGDYAEIAGRLSPAAIEENIEGDFRSLISPAGMATRKFILRDPLNLTPLALRKLDRFQLDDNFILFNSVVFTRDLQHLLFFLDPVYPSSNTRDNLGLIRHIEATLTALSPELKGLQVEYYGGTAVAVANSVRVKKDIVLTVSIAMAFFLLVFIVFFRKPGVILLMFVPVLVGTGVSIAMLTLLYGKVSAIALGVGVIFIGITVDYSLHLFTHLRTGQSVPETLGRISLPVMMGSLTTASAFLCLTVVKSEALKQIGVFAAFAVIISALTLLIVIPLLTGKMKGWTAGKKTGIAERLMAYNFEKNRILVAGVIVLSILLSFTAGKIRFNGDISTLNYMTAQLSSSESTLRSISSVANSSVYLLSEGSTLDEALGTVESNLDFFKELKEEGLITEVSAVSELMLSRQGQSERIGKWNRFWDAVGRVPVEELIRESGENNHFRPGAFDPFYELIHKSFEPIPPEEYGLLQDLILGNFITETEGKVSVATVLKVKPGAKEALFGALGSREEFIIFDNQYFINQFFDVLKEDFNRLVAVSMIVVFLILLIFFGRIEIALITFIPIMISWIWTLGLMGLFGIEINIFNIIISTFVFGLGIDYCIFMMSGLIAGYREGNVSLVPYRLSILLSALTTIAAIGVLIFARHPALKSIAVVSIFGISSVLLISYTLLPLLFSFLTRSRGKMRLEPLTLYGFLSTLFTFTIFLGFALLVTLLLPVFIILPLRRKTKKGWINRIIRAFSSFVVSIGFIIRKRYIGRELLDFHTPSVIISNHQSQLDLLMLLQLHRKMIVLVNRWVWNNFFYGGIVRFADFYPVYKGLDYDFKQLRAKVDEGYSILTFPEGRRSPDGKIKRFHQGAFGIADKLGLEIQPVMIHGAYDCLPKTEAFLKPGTITLRCFPRIRPEYREYEGMKTYREQVKKVTSFYRGQYVKLEEEVGTPEFYRGRLIRRYIYKGPILEWYLRLKIRFEKDYSFFNRVIPLDARIADLGCGYGFLSIMLALVSRNRNITGIDYDEGKIAVAATAAGGLERVRFLAADISESDPPPADVYVLNDVLHYLPEDEQLKVLGRCLERLPEQGMVILRDADAGLGKRTLFTRFTEWQSTRIFRFNKTRYRLTYLKSTILEEFLEKKGFRYSRHDHARLTSNIIYIIRK